ncbi:MAG: hypothetical protein AB1430_23475 [Pseudomonadota bacterium]
MDRFETDVMDELMADEAEGPATRFADDAYDEYDEGDYADEWDAGDDAADEFIGRLLGGIGRVAGGLLGGGGAGGAAGFDEGDDFEAADEYDEADEFELEGADEFEAWDEGDAMEDLVADALDAGDGDEFFRRLRRIASTVGRGIGSVARRVAPIASMIPLPQAQLIGRIANVAGRLLADGADEFEAFDELVDGLDEEAIDAAAPVLAGMVVRRAVPAVARAAAPVRRAAVRGVTQAIRTATRRQGAPAARAVARAVRATRRTVARRGMPPRTAARVVQRVAQQVARRPQAVRRLAKPLVPAARRATPRGQAAQVVARTVAPVARRVAATTPAAVRRVAPAGRYGLHPAGCPHCGNARRLRLRGPVTITIRGR